MNPEKTPAISTQEKYFLNTFPLINLIVLQNLNAYYSDYVEDIKQKVVLSLWKWKLSRSEKELTEVEWLKMANTSTRNEIKRFYSDQIHLSISLSDVKETDSGSKLSEKLQTPSPAGNTASEVDSLLRQTWEIVKNQTLREKYALLFKGREIINHLFYYKVCGIKEIADSLELTKDDFLKIYQTLPLSDYEISLLLAQNLQIKVTADNVVKSRQRIRAKLKKLQKTFHEQNIDERTFVAGNDKDVSP